MKLAIGMIGAPRSGKDYIANIFVREIAAKKVAFADAIKKSYFESLDLTIEAFEEMKETGNFSHVNSIRDGLWAYSDNKKTLHGKDYFVKLAIESSNNYNIPVFTDIRTNEEVRALYDLGQKVIVFVHSKDEWDGDKLRGSRLSKRNLLATDHRSCDRVLHIYNDSYTDIKVISAIECWTNKGWI